MIKFDTHIALDGKVLYMANFWVPSRGIRDRVKSGQLIKKKSLQKVIFVNLLENEEIRHPHCLGRVGFIFNHIPGTPGVAKTLK